MQISKWQGKCKNMLQIACEKESSKYKMLQIACQMEAFSSKLRRLVCQMKGSSSQMLQMACDMVGSSFSMLQTAWKTGTFRNQKHILYTISYPLKIHQQKCCFICSARKKYGFLHTRRLCHHCILNLAAFTCASDE